MGDYSLRASKACSKGYQGGYSETIGHFCLSLVYSSSLFPERALHAKSVARSHLNAQQFVSTPSKTLQFLQRQTPNPKPLSFTQPDMEACIVHVQEAQD